MNESPQVPSANFPPLPCRLPSQAMSLDCPLNIFYPLTLKKITMPQPINIHASDIVAYVRYEPRAIAADYKPTIKAQIHDALWMLTQQWRIGEFKGEDAGTLVKARIQTQSTKINRFESRHDGFIEPFDENIPLEAKVERLPLKPDLGLQLELGNIWFKLIAKTYPSEINELFDAFLDTFKIEPLENASEPEKNSNK